MLKKINRRHLWHADLRGVHPKNLANKSRSFVDHDSIGPCGDKHRSIERPTHGELTIAIFCRTTAGDSPTKSISWNFLSFSR